MTRLSSLVLRVSHQQTLKFAANVLGQGLMRTSWWLHALVWLVSKIRGWDQTIVWFLILKQLPAIADELVMAFSRHIWLGKDTSDPSSAGGLNAQEVATTVGLLKACNVAV